MTLSEADIYFIEREIRRAAYVLGLVFLSERGVLVVLWDQLRLGC